MKAKLKRQQIRLTKTEDVDSDSDLGEKKATKTSSVELNTIQETEETSDES